MGTSNSEYLQQTEKAEDWRWQPWRAAGHLICSYWEDCCKRTQSIIERNKTAEWIR